MVLGLSAAAGLSRVLASVIFGVEPLDPVTFAGVAAVLIVVACVAGLMPVRRAARVDPMVALRCD
jgi:ABC-type antimicrobial peptide transport system permease subunit